VPSICDGESNKSQLYVCIVFVILYQPLAWPGRAVRRGWLLSDWKSKQSKFEYYTKTVIAHAARETINIKDTINIYNVIVLIMMHALIISTRTCWHKRNFCHVWIWRFDCSALWVLVTYL